MNYIHNIVNAIYETDRMKVSSLGDMQSLLDGSPFIQFLQLRCEAMDAAGGMLELSMPMRPELERAPGAGKYHGGSIASLIDTAGDFAVVMVAGGSVPTINFRVDYLRPTTGSRVQGRALIRRVGKTIGVVDVDVIDEQGRLCAVGRGCFGVPSPEVSP